MYNNFKLNKLSLSVISILFGTVGLANAQDQKASDDVEVIEITGFKGSLLKSLNNKRTADSVTDSIFAEDIGKSADQDIGEALQRVTGVSIQRGEGAGATEGTTVSIRGAGPNLNNISLNGIVLTSNTENQAVDLSAFSSDILSSIEVMKTSAADQDEGSLGANVELKTFRPLNSDKNRRVLEVQGRYDDYIEDYDYKLSGSFSEKFMDDTLGFYVTGFKETQSTRRDMFFTDEFVKYTVPEAINLQTGQPMGEEVTGLMNSQNGFKMFSNNLERTGLTSTIQWAISDNTELVLTGTYSDQYREQDDDSIVSIGDQNPYIEADIPRITDATNPWIVFDPASQMIVKKLDRMARGRTTSTESGITTKNTVFNLEFSHYFTDTFKMDLRTGYSKTTADDDYFTNFNSNNFLNSPNEVLEALPSDQVQATGYDCTSGVCYSVTGTDFVDFGPDIDGVPQTGHPDEPNEDNLVKTAYNPDDLRAIHLQQANTRDRMMYDKQKSVYLDFDWDVDLGPITKFEFGGKYQTRDKDVFNQGYFWNNAMLANTDIPTSTQLIESIRLIDVYGGETGYGDSFLKDLGYARTNTTDGWATIDAQAALAKLFETDEVVGEIDLSNDRQISLENKALYFKTNFALLDEQLTGNVGIRYVESSVESLGYSSVNFQNRNLTSYDLILLSQDTSLTACTEAQRWIDPNATLPNGNPDQRNPNVNLAGQPSADGKTMEPIASQTCYDDQYNGTAANRYRYLDNTTPTDPEQFGSTASNTEKNWLPSLTLNYSLNDESVIRFAASKTMARPPIDNLKPSAKFNEAVFGTGNSNGRIDNPYLKPLESTNYDLSYEWYFNDGGALTLALFRKDMSNITENATIGAHWRDVRGLSGDELSQLDPFNDILISKPADGLIRRDDSWAAGTNCMINRRHIWQTNDLQVQGDCDLLNMTVVRNGAGGKNTGLELGYNQNYDFLPGLWSGLGTAFNYTYSDSLMDSEVGPLGVVLPALPMENVSKHVYNLSTFWEKDGNLIRLAYTHRTDSLANRSFKDGALWNEGGGQLDISATYKLNDTFTLTFNAVNLNNKENRQYYTNMRDDAFAIEGNALEGEANKSRTIRNWVSGSIYRIGIRANF
ncbi:TonB-dependent receptor [Saccharobesus litoralis]|uniref:TonB-dependent receptor n=1 Tax=Saccharobesus litoralis TaxID=2172099 RepID=A0A2S0VW54_9ALTE|nr:TonB-dependent receptor [Saccharobesus litoralis]AWB68340.1 TonB-dependent receptor [Saccharobesus litoralis]